MHGDQGNTGQESGRRGTGEAGAVRGGEALQDASWCLENQQTHFNKGFVST